MPTKKRKDFTTADGAIDKFFTPKKQVQQANNTDSTNNTKYTHDTDIINSTDTTKKTNKMKSSNNINNANVTNTTEDSKYTNITNNIQNTTNTDINNITQYTKPTNVSKHYKERGKRGERFGLLLDEQLKKDLNHLSMARGSKSINDFIITILIEHIEKEENQTKLEQYRKLLQE